ARARADRRDRPAHRASPARRGPTALRGPDGAPGPGRGRSPDRSPQHALYGVVVDSVKVSVRLYEPVRSASVAPMCWRNVMVTGSLETGAVHVDFENSTCSGSGNENDPLVRWPGSLTVSAASPAVEITFAGVLAS